MSLNTIHTWACEHPSKTAVIHNGTSISYSAFASAIGATFDFIDTQHLPEDHNVVVIIDDLLDCWVTVLALQAHGLNTICMRTTELLNILEVNNIAGVVTTEQESPKHQLQPGAIASNRIIRIPNPEYRDEEMSRYTEPEGSKKTGNHILYTSGTTGTYKKLVPSADQQKRRDVERIQQMGLGDDSFVHCFDYGLWTSVGYMLAPSTWRAKGCVILDQRPEWPHHFLQSGVTRAVLLPDKLNQLLNSVGDLTESSPPKNFTLHASGGFISRKLAEQVIDRLTKNLAISYGSTEVAIASLESMVTDLDDLHWLAPTHVRCVEIVDTTGSICPINEEGEVRIRLEKQDCSSYLDDPDASKKVFREGYFYPGDMAIRRADGRIRMLGRSADVVNFRGQKHSVSPIEDSIQNFLGVNAACIFSGLNDAGEEEVVVTIESEQWPEKSHLNHLGHELEQFDQIRFAIVYPFPRTQTGAQKIDRSALRKLIFPVE
ncbi:MAG: class I adenylate-forming enzyme family protein [Halioglobus sp.]|nr:class I adenylate-forming enzyme family protein [Halioglobus sp.]